MRVSVVMLNYPYSTGDLLGTPQTYRYSTYQGAPFVEAWRASRLQACGQLPAPAPLLLADPGPETTTDSATLLSQLCLDLRADRSTFSPRVAYWLPRLLKKFEVSKRLHESYETAAPHRPQPHSPYSDLLPYLLLAECMLHGWAASGAAYYLSALLKLTDTLVSQQARLTADQGAYLAWLLAEEQHVLGTLAAEVGL